jgi:hypothetical protein
VALLGLGGDHGEAEPVIRRSPRGP